MKIWRWFWLLVALNAVDAFATTWEISRVGFDAEANTVLRTWMEQYHSVLPMYFLKAFSLFALGQCIVQMLNTRMSRWVPPLVVVLCVPFVWLACLHGAILVHVLSLH